MYVNPHNPISKRPIIGRKFGKLLVLSWGGKSRKYLCRCDCGKTISVWSSNIIQGCKNHCGCSRFADRDIIGRRFGRWLVIGRHNGSVEKWDCRCDCGNKGVAYRTHLIGGNSRSCGCLQREKVAEIGRKNRRFSWEESFRRRKRPYLTHVWRKMVLERDHEKCQVCGSDERLAVHHKDNWIDFPVKRLDIDNGVTMCQPHHIDFHKKYGQGRNTVAQWNRYLMEERLFTSTPTT